MNLTLQALRTAACARCLRTDYLFGAAGNCSQDNICICPDGYDGFDDWLEYNDCHVNQDLRRGIRIFVLALEGLILLLTAVAFYQLHEFWGFQIPGQRLMRGISSKFHHTTSTDSNGLQSESYSKSEHLTRRNSILRFNKHINVSAYSLKVEMKSYQRQRNSLFVLAFFASFAVWIMVYNTYLLHNIRRFEHNAFLDCSLAFATICFLSALWLLSYVWFESLPSLKLYGKILNLNSLLIAYPNIVRTIIGGHIIVVSILGVLFAVVMPNQYPESYDQWNDAFVITIALSCVDFAIMFLIICFLLRKCFIKMIQETHADEMSYAVDQASKFKSTKRTVDIVIVLTFLFTLLTIPVFISIVKVEAIKSNNYIVFQSIVVLGNCAVLAVSWVFVFRTAGDRKFAVKQAFEDEKVIENYISRHQAELDSQIDAMVIDERDDSYSL